MNHLNLTGLVNQFVSCDMDLDPDPDPSVEVLIVELLYLVFVLFFVSSVSNSRVVWN